MAAVTIKRRKLRRCGFEVACPGCGTPGGLDVNLPDLTLWCGYCATAFPRKVLRTIPGRDARRMLRWLKLAASV